MTKPSDAAFREALRAYGATCFQKGRGYVPEARAEILDAMDIRQAEAFDRVLALYAERDALVPSVGEWELYWVEKDEIGSRVIYLSENHRPGQCVRVRPGA